MSIARTGALPESYKYVKVSIQSFEDGRLRGQLYHDSLDKAAAFGCLSEMALYLEALFDDLRYPMKSVDQRSFIRKRHEGMPLEGVCETTDDNGLGAGNLAEFRLHVKYRFHATWQGEITDIRDGSTFCFDSFLELMGYFERSLGRDGRNSGYGLGKRMCEVAVRNLDRYIMAGDVSHPAVEKRGNFASEYELKEELEHMLQPVAEGEEERKIVVPRSVMVDAGNFGPMTFVVRVLFRRNATWQGTICWKEKRRQVSFRSFLELLLLMQEAAADSQGWNEELKIASGDME